MGTKRFMSRLLGRGTAYVRNLLRSSSKKERLIRKVQARKRYRASLPYHYRDVPLVSLVVQSFNHRGNIARLVERIRLTGEYELIVCEDGSVDGSERAWRKLLTRPNDFLIQSNDIHEIRTYNRAISLARGEFVGVLQDDDIPPRGPAWVANVVDLFRRYQKLAILGCWNGWRFNFDDFEASIGSPVGAGVHFDAVGISRVDPLSKFPFQFVEAVGIGPMFFRRRDFEALGGFNLELSGAGEPGIWLDYELCLRAWVSGWQVGVYETEAFERNVGGQGTMMFGSEKRSNNYAKNLKYVEREFSHRINAVHRTVDDLNSKLPCRSGNRLSTQLDFG